MDVRMCVRAAKSFSFRRPLQSRLSFEVMESAGEALVHF